jgi:hypothetical protein
MLVTGSPLQIYHPDYECEYMLVAVFIQIKDGFYKFLDLSTEEYSNFFGTHIN